MKYQKRPRVSYYGRLRSATECADWYAAVDKLRNEADKTEKSVVQSTMSFGEMRAAQRAVNDLQRNRK